MTLIRRAFEPQIMEEDKTAAKRIIINMSLNFAEYKQLQEDMLIIKQAKDSTALKQLWKIGRLVIHDKLQGQILGTLLDNDRRNQRIGIHDVSAELKQM